MSMHLMPVNYNNLNSKKRKNHFVSQGGKKLKPSTMHG